MNTQCPIPADFLAASDFSCSDLPPGCINLVEQQFAGANYGQQGFGPEFRTGLLAQVANANKALELFYDAAKADGHALTLDEINEIVDAFGPPEEPSANRWYAQPLIIATVREDIGRIYLKSLQRHGQMMGTSYAALVKSIEVAEEQEAEEVSFSI